jgi:hypothetical protein
MRRFAVAFLIVLGLLAGSISSSFAAWDFAQWRMTADQLSAASGGRLMPCTFTVAACDIRLAGYHPSHFVIGLTVAGLQADATFELDPALGLVRTVLKFGGDGRNVPYLQRALGKLYGPPSDVKKSWVPHVLWHDTATATTISLIDLSPSYVLVSFEPVSPPTR